MEVYFKVLNENSKLPIRGSEYAAGLDLYSPIEFDINPGQQVKVPLGLSIYWTDPEYYAQIHPRSGLCANRCITTEAGVIDYDYRGEINVLLYNYGTIKYHINVHDRIAQLVFIKINIPKVFIDIERGGEIPDRGGGFPDRGGGFPDRGGGFGSSGV